MQLGADQVAGRAARPPCIRLAPFHPGIGDRQFQRLDQLDLGAEFPLVGFQPGGIDIGLPPAAIMLPPDIGDGAADRRLADKDGWSGKRGAAVEGNYEAVEKANADAEVAVSLLKDGVSRVILTGVGEGPVRTEEALISEKGEPISVLY